jgi:hypothetical protein
MRGTGSKHGVAAPAWLGPLAGIALIGIARMQRLRY